MWPSASSGRCRSTPRSAGPTSTRPGLEKGARDSGRTIPDGPAAEPDDHALGRSRGGLATKLRLAVDASSHVRTTVVIAGQRGDAPVFTEVMDCIRVPRPGGGRPRILRPDHALADRAYSCRPIREYLRRRQIPHAIPEKRDQAGYLLGRGSTGGRPPGFDREVHKRGHKGECRIGL